MLQYFLFTCLSTQFYQTVTGGSIKQETNPKFTWISPSILEVYFPNGEQDRMKLKTTSSIPGVHDPCLFKGKFLKDTNATITVSGCYNDSLIEITIFSKNLFGSHIFSIRDGLVVNLSENGTRYGDDGVIPGDEPKRVRRQSVTITGNVDDFLIPPEDNAPTLAGGAGGGAQGGGSLKIPAEVSINMKLGYEDSFLNKIGSTVAAVEYINKVVTHGKSYFLIPSLKTKIHLKFPDTPTYYPGHDWQPDINLHEARQYQQDSSVPHTFWCHKENTYFDGMAYVGGACRRDGTHWGVSLQKWSSDLVYAAQTFAHETGHLFGMNHDFIKEGSNYESYPSRPDSNGNQCKNTGLMSYGDPLRVTEWSTCSLEDFKAWYNDRGFTCLKETSTSDVSSTPGSDVPEYMQVSSSGGASSALGNAMGLYRLQPYKHNGYPMWKQEQGDQYLFVTNNKYWGIGADINSIIVGLYLDRNPPPNLPDVKSTDWWYYDNGWKKDQTISIGEFTERDIEEPAIPEYVQISSTGGASIARGSAMGIFKLQAYKHNNYPMWKQDQGDFYLFVTSNGYWGIGEDINSIIVLLYLNKDTTPDLPENGDWRYYDTEWKQDQTISIVALTESDTDFDYEEYDYINAELPVPDFYETYYDELNLDDTVEFISSGDGGIHQKKRMGTYTKTSRLVQGFPVYEQNIKKLNKKQFLFVAPDDSWRVGPDTTTYKGSGLKNHQRSPTPPRTGWQYRHSGKWIKDASIKAIIKM